MKTKLFNFLSSFLLLFVFGFSVQAQSISGTVTDENGVPLPGATVLVEGTSNGVSTDFDGNYSINASSGDTLVFSFVGYSNQSVVVGSSATVNVSLQPDNALSEVVVTALGVKRNVKAVGYSITQVDGEELSDNKTTNAINALQGKVAGVVVNGSAMGAKGSSRVVIRGASSLNGNNQPLYVIDGITINNDNLGAAGMWGGTDYGDGVSSINPDDIESVSVLKGGAAAALYGSRASNGVIIINTKTGAGAKGIGVEYNTTMQFDVLNNSLVDVQTIYGQGRDGVHSVGFANRTFDSWGGKLDGSMKEQFDGVSRPYTYTGDNQDKFYRVGETYTNTIAVSTANENSNTRFSATNLNNQDVTPNSSLKRNSFSVNNSNKFGDKISVDVNMKYVLEDQVGNPNMADGPSNSNWPARYFANSIDILNTKGEGGNGTNLDGLEFGTSENIYLTNPYYSAYEFDRLSNKERFIGAINARYDVTDYLYLRARIGGDRYTLRKTNHTPYGTRFQPMGSIQEESRNFKQYDADAFLGTDNLQIVDDLTVNAFVGVGTNYQNMEMVSASGGDFIVPFLVNVKNTKNQSTGYNFWEKKIESLYGSAEFGFQDWAFLTVTARNDWFSTLSLKDKESPNNDLYTSASLSLVLSDVMDLGDTVSFLKLRGGYSQVAGGADNPYSLSLSYGIVGQGHLGASLGQITGSTIPNSEITPFEKNETEFGVDIRMFDNKLSIDATYYDNETLGDIVGVSASQTSGYGAALANLGNISNKGIELLIKGEIMRTDDFAWNASINYSKNTSEVVSTNDAGGNIAIGNPRDLETGINVTHIVGEQWGALYGNSYERDSQGRIVHIMQGGTPVPKIGGKKILGFGVAPESIGIGSTFRYKDFNASILVEGKMGGSYYSGTNNWYKVYGLHKDTVPAGGREAGFTPDGVMEDGTVITTSIPHSKIEDYWSQTLSIGEENIYSSDYMRLRQLSIGYNVPSSMLEGSFISDANVSLIGRNLFLLSNSSENIDPESSYSAGNAVGLERAGMPVPRTIGLNINLKF
ncbi:SusC/RagA family TonB-linked outer membrane protein [Flavobacteriaceae bacterium]|nr:SusC/RagA family TonB-linked outer membrane protein [Flavobacteriaceae bacterium]MDA9373621.1 SusC/RagA family TonB-linked outer membrane protein [Flavobacteriaceae bacterium]MDB4005903.1 SusC/RagA family TonB-linked outer membrane protein [Flavobacteriaceae bacterium]MDB4014667.1 SusC/RagA family TonB-linked outer membrane protein [Flavobacteriaceae bacterium]MDC0593264.1 SusC/RagA family TonB-linked outer membrane protein [Flavobacteriaceae bacterium]